MCVRACVTRIGVCRTGEVSALGCIGYTCGKFKYTVGFWEWMSVSRELELERLNTRGVARRGANEQMDDPDGGGGGGMRTESVGGFDTSRQAHDVAAYFL